MDPEVIHIPQLAQMLSRTESSIRSAIRDGAQWLPPYFRQGVRICWRMESVRQFLREYEEGSMPMKKSGRPRREPPRLRSVDQGKC